MGPANEQRQLPHRHRGHPGAHRGPDPARRIHRRPARSSRLRRLWLMPYADPEVAATRNREYWRERGRQYRANRTPPPPPVSRRQVLEEDIAQATALAELEAKRRGRGRAQAEL